MTVPTSLTDRYLVGVSLKMYFSHARTVEWCRAVADIAQIHPATVSKKAELFVFPDYLSVAAAREIFGDHVAVGVQDLGTDDVGAFTGEVSGVTIAELGCTMVEVGHAERRQMFGDSDAVVSAKMAAALRNALTPVLCVGEAIQGVPADAATECIRQFDDAMRIAHSAGQFGRIIVAYEPLWAIGAAEAASPEYIRAVCGAVRDHARKQAGGSDTPVIYGGSAGPGLVTTMSNAIDGVFLGRFAHDPTALAGILDEVMALAPAFTRG